MSTIPRSMIHSGRVIQQKYLTRLGCHLQLCSPKYSRSIPIAFSRSMSSDTAPLEINPMTNDQTTASESKNSTSASNSMEENSTRAVYPHVDPKFRYGDVIVLSDSQGERRLIGPLKQGGSKDSNRGKLSHDSIIGLTPLSTVKTHKGAKCTVHWPSLDEYCTKVKRQATIMYPKDATSAVHLLDLFPGAHVLEAGTGNGSMTMYIQRAIQGPGSHLDTVDIRNEHSFQAEQNIERFWRGMYRPGVNFWRSAGGLERVIQRLNGSDQGQSAVSDENLPPNPHSPDHQYDAISLDLPNTKSVLLDLWPLLKPDRYMCLYIVNMSQILEMVQWLRKINFEGYSVERVLEVEWKEWSVKSAAVRSKVKDRVHVDGFGKVSLLSPSAPSTQSGQDTPNAENNDGDDMGGTNSNNGRATVKDITQKTLTMASDNIPDDALGWVCRPMHMPKGHTGFLVQLRKNSQDHKEEDTVV